MQLRARLSQSPETISDFVVAAEQKFWEGLELVTSERVGAGIYLLGYAAEMWLKAAAFRFDGASPADFVQPRLVPARIWLSLQPESIPHESFHSVIFWLRYLLARRRVARRMLPATIRGELEHRVRRIYGIWWVEMRYRGDQALDHEGERVYRDVAWLRDQFVTIGR
jgi:hypothetical protein